MNLTFFGHACVGLEGSFKLLFDPYEPGGFGGHMAYPPIDFAPDLILLSHHHLDHCYTAPFPDVPVVGPEAFSAPHTSEAWFKRLQIQTLEVDHDAFHGRTRGGQSSMIRVVLDGLRIVHSGDIGELPEQKHLDTLTQGQPIDLLFVVCGGYYTLGGTEAAELAKRLQARITIPIHYRTKRCTLPHLAGPESMVAQFRHVRRWSDARVEITREMCTEGREEVWMLEWFSG